jgi:hypothetical protein
MRLHSRIKEQTAAVLVACARRYIYVHEASKELGKGGPTMGIMGAAEWLRSHGHAVKSQWNAAKGAVDLMQVISFSQAWCDRKM